MVYTLHQSKVQVNGVTAVGLRVMGYKNIKIILLLIFLFLCQIVTAQDEGNINSIFSSPDKSCSLRYKGKYRGVGSYYHILKKGEKRVYKGYFRYGPIVNWVSDKVAELRIPSGSPNYNSFFYDCEHNKLSAEYMLPIAADAKFGEVATLDLEAIRFYKLFRNKLTYKLHLPRLEPMGFLVFCKPDARFDRNGTFILDYQCPHNPEKRITIERKLYQGHGK